MEGRVFQMTAEEANVSEQPTPTGVGVFTPPPAPCGNSECWYVDFDCIHVRTCEPAMLLIRDQPHQGITHVYRPLEQ